MGRAATNEASGETSSHVHIDERKWPERRHWQFRAQRLGEDEFADHQVRFEYPQDLIAGALTATASAVELLEQGAEPFGAAEQRWKIAAQYESG